MAELTYEVKEFIEENIELIEYGDWDQVYTSANFNLDSESTGMFTSAMLSIGIDPIQDGGLDFIPPYYLSSQHIDTFVIPEKVTVLCEGCFSYSDIKKITIPERVYSIGSYAFYDCLKLEEVTILSEKILLGDGVFTSFPEKLTFRCYKDSLVANLLADLLEGTDAVLEYIDD